jgi:hypothetical protein
MKRKVTMEPPRFIKKWKVKGELMTNVKQLKEFTIQRCKGEDGFSYVVSHAYDDYGNPGGGRVMGWFATEEEAIDWINTDFGAQS